MQKSNRRLRALICFAAALASAGCVTSRVEDARVSDTGIEEGEGVVVMAKSYHLGNETEEKYIRCVEKALGNGKEGLRVIPHREFVDSLFPWFEPRTAPTETKHLPKLMDHPGVIRSRPRKCATSSGWMATRNESRAAAACPALPVLAAVVASALRGGRTTPTIKPLSGI